MIKSSRRALQCLAILAVCVSFASAQDPTGKLQGQITDPSSANVAGAVVTVRNTTTSFTATQQSARDGSFYFSFLPVGEYTLRVTESGFEPYDLKQIRIDIGRSVNLPIELKIASGTSTVEVVATGASVDVSSALGNVVSSREATRPPLNGRNLTQLGLLQPGVAPIDRRSATGRRNPAKRSGLRGEW